MKPVTLAFAVHNHQPSGNFDSVFQGAFERSYRPFVDVLERHPGVKFTEHWTGTLLEWLVRNHPGFIERLRAMVERGQLEILTGAYYEPVLTMIPERDRQGQIQKLTEAVHRRFGYTPRGMWLAERVWEQPLAASLARAGIEFTVVDDTHFRHAGLRDDQLLGYYVTEEGGEPLKLVPIDKTLRYTIPFRDVEETVRYLEQVAALGRDALLVHADDGEKFGVWPKTYKHVYEDGWLERFCRMLEERQALVRTVHLGPELQARAPEGRIYLPTASYSEMMKWALDAESFQRLERFEGELNAKNLLEGNGQFVRGGYWRNFLAKYPEANQMQKKMLRLSRRAERVASAVRVHHTTLDHLWAGQCNDPYWHGVFGGLYLPNLRYAVYHSLLKAEADLDRLEKLPPVRHEEADFDADGWQEVLIESDVLNLYFKPNLGGSLVELDFKPAALNLLDILSRREEGYHRRLLEVDRFKDAASIHEGVLVKEEGLERHLQYDWYRRASFLDHFLGPGTTLEAVAACRYGEEGDFVNQPYQARVKRTGDEVKVLMQREGGLWAGGAAHRIAVRKTVRYVGGADQFVVEYAIINREARGRDIDFAVECNVGLMAGDAPDRYYAVPGRSLEDRRLRSRGEVRDVESVELLDEYLGVKTVFHFSHPCTLWRFPVETVSLSESGFERLYQSSVVFPHWRMKLEGEVRLQITQTVSTL
jgi:alpha-amylase